MIRETFPVGPLGCNCSIIACPRTRQAIVVDPGGDAPAILAALARHGLSVVGLFHTHAHFDHLGATAELKDATHAPVWLHAGDQPLYENVPLQGRVFGAPATPPPDRVDHHLEDGEVLRFGELAGQVLHTPGHTPGSVCLHVGAERIVFTGDTLFAGGVGRTDLWGGSWKELVTSLSGKLLALPDDTTVVPGHGPLTTIGTERTSNPFLATGAG